MRLLSSLPVRENPGLLPFLSSRAGITRECLRYGLFGIAAANSIPHETLISKEGSHRTRSSISAVLGVAFHGGRSFVRGRTLDRR